jgi:hypothetical protein
LRVPCDVPEFASIILWSERGTCRRARAHALRRRVRAQQPPLTKQRARPPRLSQLRLRQRQRTINGAPKGRRRCASAGTLATLRRARADVRHGAQTSLARLQRTPRELAELRSWLSTVSAAADLDYHRRAAPRWRAQLERDSGWCYLQEPDQSADAGERLTRALMRASENVRRDAGRVARAGARSRPKAC